MTQKKKRLSKEEWLRKALILLARSGESQIRIDRLTSALGVTKGSFYWHFKSRADFVSQLVDYWDRRFTRIVPENLADDHSSAKNRLLRLMEMVYDLNSTRFDLAIRSWATHEPGIAKRVRKVDRFRSTFVRSLFEEMGFEGDELDVRTRAFVTFISLESSLFARISKSEIRRQLIARHAFFTRP